jgi:Transcriptional regulator, AbiEi antitoxin
MATAFGQTLTNVTSARVSITSLVSIVEKRTVVRAPDLYRSGIHPEALSRTLRRGLLLKIGRGLYARKDFPADFERQIMLACKRVPNGINGTKIAEPQNRFQQLLKQQLATHSARAQQTCLLGTSRPRDELADPEFLISISSGDLNVFPAVALNFENLVAKVLPITISSAAMVKEKGRMIGIFELDEHFSTLDNPAALCALLYFRYCFLTDRELEQDFAMLMGHTQASRDRRILVLR